MPKKIHPLLLFTFFCTPIASCAQHNHDQQISFPVFSKIEPQPLLAQAIRLNEALTFLGSSLSEADADHLKKLQTLPLTEETSKVIQAILDPYCLAIVEINPEARVKVNRGPAQAKLIQNGWTSYLIKVHNEARSTAHLKAESPNAAPAFHIYPWPTTPHPAPDHVLTKGQVENRFLEIQMFQNRPLLSHLSGLLLEYAVVQIFSKDAGQREVEIGFNIGQGTQDIGFRNTINILFDVKPSVKMIMRVKDEDGSPATASFTISDGIERIIPDSVKAVNRSSIDYRLTMAQMEYWEPWLESTGYKIPARLTGIYPLPSRRVAAFDEYPDFFFQPQVYRADGEHVLLPPGKYNVVFSRGPEYLTQTKQIVIPAGVDSVDISFQLKRWVNMSKLGWYSGDHHIHAAGCSHYESPEEGVEPAHMLRQMLGENLNVGAVLTWGPGWYHQKNYFTGKTHPLSTQKYVMRYDVEVSGFPSSHSGHVVLLGLKEDDYPGTKTIEDWPSWTQPVLSWAKKQGGITGYAHSGNGLQPENEKIFQLPNYVKPKMDGIGANEYVVTVTQNVIDFYSLGDTPAPWELNMLYHTLNCGFRTRFSGETDYPCVYDERVGLARSYFKTTEPLTYENYLEAIKSGRSYVTEGRSHIIDFSVDGVEAGVNNSELKLSEAKSVKVSASVAAFLPEQQSEEDALIARTPLDKQPYWSIERARIGKTRKVAVELLVNGEPVDTVEIVADGQWKQISFNYPIKQSGWMALRVYPSSHTNPVFVILNGKPIHVRKSAEWCRDAVDQCWEMKQGNIRAEERSDAEAVYKKARAIYEQIIKNSDGK